MNREEAYRLLCTEIGDVAALGHRELVLLVGKSLERRVRGSDSAEYLLEVRIRRDGGDALMIEGAIDTANPQRFERLESRLYIPAPDSQ